MPGPSQYMRVWRCDEVVKLKVGTANVMYPREEESMGMSARRLQLAQQFCTNLCLLPPVKGLVTSLKLDWLYLRGGGDPLRWFHLWCMHGA